MSNSRSDNENFAAILNIVGFVTLIIGVIITYIVVRKLSSGGYFSKEELKPEHLATGFVVFFYHGMFSSICFGVSKALSTPSATTTSGLSLPVVATSNSTSKIMTPKLSPTKTETYKSSKTTTNSLFTIDAEKRINEADITILISNARTFANNNDFKRALYICGKAIDRFPGNIELQGLLQEIYGKVKD